MDTTIIEYLYWDTFIDNSGNKRVDSSFNEIGEWKTVQDKDYNTVFNSETYRNSHGDPDYLWKPIKLVYNLLYDSSGNLYNNLNVRNISEAVGSGNIDLLKNIYIYKPNAEFSDRNILLDICENNVELLSLSENNKTEFIKLLNFSNVADEAETVETQFTTDNFDISENVLYDKEENSLNFILRPGKWYFLYDASGNTSEGKVRKEQKMWLFISSIKIPHVDFLYDNEKVDMQLDNVNYNNIFLRIGNEQLVNMRSHFSKYYSTLGKDSITDINNDYLRIFFEFVLWSPDNINTYDITNLNSWFLPENYKGILDERINQVPTFMKNETLEDNLYTGLNNNEPGFNQDNASYKSTISHANHIARIYGPLRIEKTVSRGVVWDLSNSSIAENGWQIINNNIYQLNNSEDGYSVLKSKDYFIQTNEVQYLQFYINEVSISTDNKAFIGISGDTTITSQSSFTGWPWQIIKYGFYRDDNDNLFYIHNNEPSSGPITLNNQDINNLKLELEISGNTFINYNYYTPAGNKVEISTGMSYSQTADQYIYIGFRKDERYMTLLNVKCSRQENIGTANNLKDTSNNFFYANDFSRNFIDSSGNREIFFLNIENTVFDIDYDGVRDLVDENKDIDDWEALLICPSGVILQDGSRNIISGVADSSNNSGFSLGFVGNGTGEESYIYKDVCGNTFPNTTNTLNLAEYGITQTVNAHGQLYTSSPFTIRYKIRKNTLKTTPPYHDVFIFINEQFVIKMPDYGCKLNDISYWGTPYDNIVPYKEYSDTYMSGYITTTYTNTFTNVYTNDNPYVANENETLVSESYDFAPNPPLATSERYITLNTFRSRGMYIEYSSDGAKITKSFSGSGWNDAYFMSNEKIERDDDNWQKISFNFVSTARGDYTYIGLANHEVFQTASTTLAFSLYSVDYDNEPRIYENGNLVAGSSSMSKSLVWEIHVKGNEVKYVVIDEQGNEITKHVSSNIPTYPLYVAGTYFTYDNSIKNIKLFTSKTTNIRKIDKLITAQITHGNYLTTPNPEENYDYGVSIHFDYPNDNSYWDGNYFLSNETIQYNDDIWQIVRWRPTATANYTFGWFGLTSKTSYNTSSQDPHDSIEWGVYHRHPSNGTWTWTIAHNGSTAPDGSSVVSFTNNDNVYWEIRVKGTILQIFQIELNSDGIITSETSQYFKDDFESSYYPMRVACNMENRRFIYKNVRLYSEDNMEDVDYGITIQEGNDPNGYPFSQHMIMYGNTNTFISTTNGTYTYIEQSTGTSGMPYITSNEYIERNDNEWQYVRFRWSGTYSNMLFGMRSLNSTYNAPYMFYLFSGWNADSSPYVSIYVPEDKNDTSASYSSNELPFMSRRSSVWSNSTISQSSDQLVKEGDIYGVKVKGDVMHFFYIPNGTSQEIILATLDENASNYNTIHYPLYLFAGLMVQRIRIEDVEMHIVRSGGVSTDILATIQTQVTEPIYLPGQFISPNLKGVPQAKTILLQSLKTNFIEDVYRPSGVPNSSFIDKILYNDPQYIDISNNTPTLQNITLNYADNDHSGNTTTTNFTDISNGVADISVNGINNYPCIISYSMKEDPNITPIYKYANFMLDDVTSNDENRVFTNTNNWDSNYVQVKPLNYSYLFDAGEGKTLVLDINDFQFFHELGKAYERLEIVAGDLSGDEIVFNENIKNDGNGIIWMHNLENTERWNDASPMSDEDLRRNTSVSSSQTPRVAETKEEKAAFYPKRYETRKEGYGRYKRWAFSGYFFYYYYNYYKYSWYVRYYYGPPDYVAKSAGPLNNDNPKYKYIRDKWEEIGNKFRYTSYNYWRSNRYYRKEISVPMVGGQEVPDSRFTEEKYGVYVYYVYRSYYWYYRPAFIYYRNTQSKEIFNKATLILKTYETINYNPLPGNLKESKNGVIVTVEDENGVFNQNNSTGEGTKIGVFVGSLGVRDYRNGDGLKEAMSFKNGKATPYSKGFDGTDNFGDPNLLTIEPGVQLADIDYGGSVLPKNKQRAIKILDFFNSETGTGILSDIDDKRIWRIYTNKRFVRMNYFAFQSSTNSSFNITINRTLSESERNLLKKRWESGQEEVFQQVNRGIIPMNISDAYIYDLSDNQIESISNELKPQDLNSQLTQFPNSNYYVFENKEVPYISLCNYYLRDQINDILLSSRIKKTALDDTNSYKYDDNRNLRELNIYPNLSVNNTNIVPVGWSETTDDTGTVYYVHDDGRTSNTIPTLLINPKQKYIYDVKIFNKLRDQILPYFPKQLITNFVRSSSELDFFIPSVEKIRLKQNLINFWLGDIHKTYIKLYLFIWEPYSIYLDDISGGKIDITSELNNINLNNDGIKNKINIDQNNLFLEIEDGNIKLWKNNETNTNIPVENHTNQFNYLQEIIFDFDTFFYGKNSVGFPEQNFKYQLTKFKGQYIFNWTYKVFQPDGIYNNVTPLSKVQSDGTYDEYSVNAQVFDVSTFTKDDFIYDTNAPLLSWVPGGENEINIKLSDEEKSEFLNFIELTIKNMQAIRSIQESNLVILYDISANTGDPNDRQDAVDASLNLLTYGRDISSIEFDFYIWTPNICKYDQILGEDLSSNNTIGWELPDDYFGVQDPRIKLTPYKSNSLSWNPTFRSYEIDSSGITQYGYNFDVSGVIKKTFIFNKSDIEGSAFDLNTILSSGTHFNDISFNIDKNDIFFTSNDIKYKLDDKMPNTLEYLKFDNSTGVDYGIPYISRWSYKITDDANNTIESRVVKLEGDFGDESSFSIKFSFDPNYYFELNTDGMEGATTFRQLLLDNRQTGITLGYQRNTNYLLIKVDDLIYQLFVQEPPRGYEFFQLNEEGEILTNNDDIPIKIVDNSVRNIEFVKTGLKIDGNEILLNGSSGESKYILYIRPSTDKEKTFFSKLNKHVIRNMEASEITNRFSDWEPIESNNYYSTTNQYEYGILFSSNISKNVAVIEEKEEEIDNCSLCRNINHNSKDNLSRRLRYSNREKQTSRTVASKFTTICND